jgi:hypothetical protein
VTVEACGLLEAANALLNRPDPATAGIWPRATALLARQALESALRDLWCLRAPGVEACSMRAQLLCLPLYLRDEELAERVSYAWVGLSRATHYHPYELPPTSSELSDWLGTVRQFAAGVEKSISPRLSPI